MIFLRLSLSIPCGSYVSHVVVDGSFTLSRYLITDQFAPLHTSSAADPRGTWLVPGVVTVTIRAVSYVGIVSMIIIIIICVHVSFLYFCYLGDGRSLASVLFHSVNITLFRIRLVLIRNEVISTIHS